ALAHTEFYPLSLHDALPIYRLYEYTGVIMDEVDRLRALIDLLVGPQSQSLQLSPLNIHEVCERVYTLVQAEFAHQIKVTRDYDEIGRAHVELQSRENLVCRL